MSNLLTDALQATLAQMDREGTNPLDEVEPFSLEEQFDRINSKLAAGMPETITEAELMAVVLPLRAARLHFVQESERKAEKRGTSARSASKKKAASTLLADVTVDNVEDF